MNFFKKVVESIYSPKFYSEIPNSKISSAIKYFLVLVVLVVTLTLVTSIPEFLFGFTKQIKSTISQVSESYPSDLELTIKSGKVTSNVKEPYIVKDKNGNKFAVIDTKTAYSADKFVSYDAPVWVTSDTVFYKGQDNDIKSQSLSQVGDAVVNKDLVNTVIQRVDPWVPYFGPLMLSITYIFLVFFYSFRLFYAFLLALLVLITAKITKVKIDYTGAYKVSIYAMTLAFIIDGLKLFVGWNGFPFMFTLISLGVVVVNFSGFKRLKS